MLWEICIFDLPPELWIIWDKRPDVPVWDSQSLFSPFFSYFL